MLPAAVGSEERIGAGVHVAGTFSVGYGEEWKGGLGSREKIGTMGSDFSIEGEGSRIDCSGRIFESAGRAARRAFCGEAISALLSRKRTLCGE